MLVTKRRSKSVARKTPTPPSSQQRAAVRRRPNRHRMEKPSSPVNHAQSPRVVQNVMTALARTPTASDRDPRKALRRSSSEKKASQGPKDPVLIDEYYRSLKRRVATTESETDHSSQSSQITPSKLTKLNNNFSVKWEENKKSLKKRSPFSQQERHNSISSSTSSSQEYGFKWFEAPAIEDELDYLDSLRLPSQQQLNLVDDEPPVTDSGFQEAATVSTKKTTPSKVHRQHAQVTPIKSGTISPNHPPQAPPCIPGPSTTMTSCDPGPSSVSTRSAQATHVEKTLSEAITESVNQQTKLSQTYMSNTATIDLVFSDKEDEEKFDDDDDEFFVAATTQVHPPRVSKSRRSLANQFNDMSSSNGKSLPTKSPAPSKEEDETETFDDDDSFLLAATQVIQSTASSIKVVPSTSRAPSMPTESAKAVSTVEDNDEETFDDDINESVLIASLNVVSRSDHNRQQHINTVILEQNQNVNIEESGNVTMNSEDDFDSEESFDDHFDNICSQITHQFKPKTQSPNTSRASEEEQFDDDMNEICETVNRAQIDSQSNREQQRPGSDAEQFDDDSLEEKLTETAVIQLLNRSSTSNVMNFSATQPDEFDEDPEFESIMMKWS